MKKWYGVRTFPGYENKVKEGIEKLIKKNALQDQIEDIFIPTYKKYAFVRKDIRLKEELVFPGYVFVKMKLTNELMYSVRGVQYIIGYAGTNEMKKMPDSITEEEINAMIKNSQSLKTELEEGQEIVIQEVEGDKILKIKNIDLQNKKITTEDGVVRLFDEIKKK